MWTSDIGKNKESSEKQTPDLLFKVLGTLDYIFYGHVCPVVSRQKLMFFMCADGLDGNKLT